MSNLAKKPEHQKDAECLTDPTLVYYSQLFLGDPCHVAAMNTPLHYDIQLASAFTICMGINYS